MDTKTLDLIRALLTNSKEFGSFWARYRQKTSDPKCDKHDASFNIDSRFSSFAVQLSFDSYLGYYGSSSCSTFMSCNADLAKKYLVRAINFHNEAIFKSMAEMMRADADGLTVKAREEIAAMQHMVDSLSEKPEAAVNAA
jgi:hypothetical protein